jgi:hypothetical protein
LRTSLSRFEAAAEAVVAVWPLDLDEEDDVDELVFNRSRRALEGGVGVGLTSGRVVRTSFDEWESLLAALPLAVRKS